MTGEILLQTPEALVRILNLASGECGAWHHHTQCVEHVVCLSGVVSVELSGPDQVFTLSVPHRCQVPVGRRHRVLNSGSTPASYLLIQGPGRYDFVD